jgi:mannonate dehydratase
MLKALKILKANDYQGILIPDHTPEMNSSSPWHTGMAFAMGYMKAALQSLDIR